MNKNSTGFLNFILVMVFLGSIVFLSGLDFRKTAWVNIENEQIAQVKAPSNWPPDHGDPISSKWTHSKSRSSTWPANHESEFTNKFPYHLAEVSARFPERIHVIETSLGWRKDHNVEYSTAWPPNHTVATSPTWHESPRPHSFLYSQSWPPTHGTTVSNTYPRPRGIPEMGGHDIELSQKFPPNHVFETSKKRPASHTQRNSTMWPVDHSTPNSNEWPNNHVKENSITWPRGHKTAQSVAVPPQQGQIGQVVDPTVNWLYVPNHLYNFSVFNIPTIPTPLLISAKKEVKGSTPSSSGSATLNADSSQYSGDSISAPASLQ